MKRTLDVYGIGEVTVVTEAFTFVTNYGEELEECYLTVDDRLIACDGASYEFFQIWDDFSTIQGNWNTDGTVFKER